MVLVAQQMRRVQSSVPLWLNLAPDTYCLLIHGDKLHASTVTIMRRDDTLAGIPYVEQMGPQDFLN